MSRSRSSRRRPRRDNPLAVYFIDSNIFFYAKIIDREYGDACKRVLSRIVDGELKAATSALALIEVANSLMKYGLSSEVRNVVDAIFSLDIPIYETDPLDVRDAMEIFDEAKISLYDCAHAAIMRRAGITNIISADKDFDRISWVRRSDPKIIE